MVKDGPQSLQDGRRTAPVSMVLSLAFAWTE